MVAGISFKCLQQASSSHFRFTAHTFRKSGKVSTRKVSTRKVSPSLGNQ
jgi:hypothetical protein